LWFVCDDEHEFHFSKHVLENTQVFREDENVKEMIFSFERSNKFAVTELM